VPAASYRIRIVSAFREVRTTMVPWLVAGAVILVVIVAAAIVVFRVVLMTADAETGDDDDTDDMDGADGEWRPPASPH